MTAIGRNQTASRRARCAWPGRASLLLVPACLALAAGHARAADPVATAAPVASPGAGCGTPEQCFARMVAAQRDVATIRARFRQTKYVAMLEEPLVSEGRFTFQRPDQVRWEMVTPEPLVVDISGSELRAGPPGEVAKVDAGPAVALFRDLAGIFTGAGDYAGNQRFTLGPGASGGNSFILTPRDPSVGRVIASIEIELDPASGGPRRVVIAEAGGDRTEITLFDVAIERSGGPRPTP